MKEIQQDGIVNQSFLNFFVNYTYIVMYLFLHSDVNSYFLSFECCDMLLVISIY